MSYITPVDMWTLRLYGLIQLLEKCMEISVAHIEQ